MTPFTDDQIAAAGQRLARTELLQALCSASEQLGAALRLATELHGLDAARQVRLFSAIVDIQNRLHYQIQTVGEPDSR